MQQAIVSTLPFLGQIVKITTRDGKEYDVKISEELPDNDKVFSIMFRNHSASGSNSNSSGSNSSSSNSNSSNSSSISSSISISNSSSSSSNSSSNSNSSNDISQIYNKTLKKNFINRKVDYTKAGTSINLDDISKQPFKLNF